MEKRVTLRDIARKTGHHYSTISLALRGELRIPASTRKKIARVAKEMGYRPDPMVTALAIYRTATKPSIYHATLAWLVNDSESVLRPDYNFKYYYLGARKCAEELGYKLEEFLLRAPGMTPARMASMLQSRGISGILIPPQPNQRIRMRIAMDWSPFAAVTFGYTLAFPELHRIASNHFRGAKTVVRKLRSLGYRRIGLCSHRVWNGRVDGNWVGGYLSAMRDDPSAPAIEPLMIEGWEGSRIKKWIGAHRLDAVIVDDHSYIEQIKRELGFAIPEELGVASLHILADDHVQSGIYQNDEEIGRSAVHQLVGLLHSNRRGIPEIPHNLLIEGTWREGAALRRVRAASPS